MNAGQDTLNTLSFNNLFKTIISIDKGFADNTAKAINRNITARNWLIGYYIVTYEQNGSDRAEYGAKTLQKLAEKLNSRSLSYRNLKLYRQFFLEFPHLTRPIYYYLFDEFNNTEQQISHPEFDKFECTISRIGQRLSAKFDNQESATKNHEIQPSPIRQPLVAQLDSDLQLPADKLFSHLSFTHFI